MRSAMVSIVVSLMLLSTGACTAGAHRDATASVGSDRIPRITALYQQATYRPVHPFRKPVRDEQARARRDLQVECDRWLAELQTEAIPTALTGRSETQAVPPPADVNALRCSLEQLKSATGQADSAAMRTAHTQALAAYQRVEGAAGCR